MDKKHVSMKHHFIYKQLHAIAIHEGEFLDSKCIQTGWNINNIWSSVNNKCLHVHPHWDFVYLDFELIRTKLILVNFQKYVNRIHTKKSH